ncbi:MAG: YbjQ family protein [Verrucomicrobiales bacterium]
MEIIFFGIIVVLYTSPVWIFLFAWWMGGRLEAKHYQSIREREALTLQLPVTPTRTLEPGLQVESANLVTGSVVVSIDYFKRILAQLRNIFGGRIRSYESLLDRARREALLRMKEQAVGATMILNVRLETSSIASTSGREGVGAVEVIAYGTAVYCRT